MSSGGCSTWEASVGWRRCVIVWGREPSQLTTGRQRILGTDAGYTVAREGLARVRSITISIMRNPASAGGYSTIRDGVYTTKMDINTV